MGGNDEHSCGLIISFALSRCKELVAYSWIRLNLIGKENSEVEFL
jgi:hypothetical protein